MLVHAQDLKLVMALEVRANAHQNVTLVAELLDDIVIGFETACRFHLLLDQLGRKRRRERSV